MKTRAFTPEDEEMNEHHEILLERGENALDDDKRLGEVAIHEKGLNGHMNILPQRIVAEIYVDSPESLQTLEALIRNFLKSEYSNCSPLSSGTYIAFRLNMLKHLRNARKKGMIAVHPCCWSDVRITSNLLLSCASDNGMLVHLVERPQAVKLHHDKNNYTTTKCNTIYSKSAGDEDEDD